MRIFGKFADSLPDDLRLKFYDALMSYVFDGIEPENQIIKSLIIAIRPSLDKEDGRVNNGGKRENSGRKPKNIENEKSNIINSNQSFSNNNQSFQILSETETRNGNKKQEINTLVAFGDAEDSRQTNLEDCLSDVSTEKHLMSKSLRLFGGSIFPFGVMGGWLAKAPKRKQKRNF